MLNKRRRRIYIVYPEAQGLMIALFVLAGSIGFFGLALGAYVFSQKIRHILEPLLSSMTPENQIVIQHMWSYFALYCGSFGLDYPLLLFVLGLVFSNRVAGPLFRISADLSKMIETDEYHPLRLRKNDLFFQVADTINKAIEKRKSKKS